MDHVVVDDAVQRHDLLGQLVELLRVLHNNNNNNNNNKAIVEQTLPRCSATHDEYSLVVIDKQTVVTHPSPWA